jgi:hypothetical protein
MSTKYDKRLEELEEKMNAAKKLPADVRGPYVGWGKEGEKKIKSIKKHLLETYGTIEGAEFYQMGWLNEFEQDNAKDES